MTNYPIDQGHGIAGRYMGLPDQFSNLDQSKIVLLPVAFDQTTTYRHGTDQGPAALIEASRHLEIYDIETNSEVYRKGICTLPTIESTQSEELLKAVYQEVLQLLKQNKFIVTLGGEHSISFAPIKAYSEFYPSLSVLQLDAHSDLQDRYEGNPWSHASVMARVLELPHVKNVVSVGIRSMSPEELKNLKRTTPFFCHDLFESDEWMHQVLTHLSDHVYLTFDLDVFDSSVMPSTGTPEPGGLNWHQVTKFLKLVNQHKQLVGFDLVELCPNPNDPSPDFLAAKLVYKILSYKFKYHS
jgi:agmatinase